MSTKLVALIWAAIIISAALAAKSQGMGDGATFGLIAGLSGAAIGALHGRGACSKACRT